MSYAQDNFRLRRDRAFHERADVLRYEVIETIGKTYFDSHV